MVGSELAVVNDGLAGVDGIVLVVVACSRPCAAPSDEFVVSASFESVAAVDCVSGAGEMDELVEVTLTAIDVAEAKVNHRRKGSCLVLVAFLLPPRRPAFPRLMTVIWRLFCFSHFCLEGL